MPNLLPPLLQPAGRLTWSIILTAVGVIFVLALMRPPLLKRPFPNKVGYALFAVIPLVGWVIAGIIPVDSSIGGWELDAIIVDGVLLLLFLHALMMVLSRKPAPADEQATWAMCFLGAVGTFALMTLAYAVLPHEWMTFANGYLKWGDTSWFLVRSNQDMLFFPWHWPFNLDYPALRDIVVTGIYVVVLGVNVMLFMKWQSRARVAEAPAVQETTPVKRSRFGRPLRRTAPMSAAAGEGV